MPTLAAAPPMERVAGLAKGYVRRARLDSLLDLLADRALIAVVAPAGFGKTQLLVHWRRLLLSAGVVTIWCDARESPASCLARLVTRDSGGDADRDPADAPGPVDRTMPAMIAQLRAARRKFALLIDDLDAITEADDRAAWRELLPSLPFNCQVIGATRGGSPFPVEELRAYGQAAVVDEQDLQFTAAEGRRMLADGSGSGGASEAIDALADALEGWPVGLASAAAALSKGADPDALLRDLTAGLPDLAGFIEREVATLPPRLREALLPLAIVDTTDARLAEAATGMADITDRIAALRGTTPIFLPGGAVPRLRGIVRRFLLAADGDPARSTTAVIHARAADWLMQNGRPSGAIPHFLAIGRIDRACEMFESCLFETVSGGGVVVALEWLRAVPNDRIRGSLRATAAWAAAVGGDSAAIDRFVPPGIEDDEWGNAISAPQRAVIGALLASHADDADAARDFLDSDLDWTAMSMPFGIVRHNLLRWLAHQSGQSFGEPAASLDAWRHVPLRSAHFYGYCFSVFREAVVRLSIGRSRSAAEIVAPVLDQADAALARDAAPSVQLSAVLAAAFRQHGDHAAARAVLAGRLEAIEALAMPESLWLGLSTAANLAADEGDVPLALDLLGRLERRAVARGLVRVEALACAERAKLMIRCGRRADSLSSGLQAGLDRIGTDLGIRASNIRLAANVGLARIALDRCARDPARIFLGEAEALARTLGRTLDVVDIQLLRFRLDGVDAATQLGAIREVGLIDDGDLDQLAEADRFGDCGGPLGEIYRTRPPARRETRIKLTQRERDIVELLARNLSNRAISEALCLGEETIKWHLKNLFVKLDAHDRRSAVAKAIAYG